MTTTVRFDGLRDLERELERLANPNTRRASARRAGVRALAPMAAAAQARAPRAQGDLADSITVGTRVSGGNAGQLAFGRTLQGGGSRAQAVQALRDAQRETASQVFIYMGPGRHPQAITQEFGTYFHPPQPYMRPAWDEESRATLERIATELWADIQRSVARAERRAARAAARAAT